MDDIVVRGTGVRSVEAGLFENIVCGPWLLIYLPFRWLLTSTITNAAQVLALFPCNGARLAVDSILVSALASIGAPRRYQ